MGFRCLFRVLSTLFVFIPAIAEAAPNCDSDDLKDQGTAGVVSGCISLCNDVFKNEDQKVTDFFREQCTEIANNKNHRKSFFETAQTNLRGQVNTLECMATGGAEGLREGLTAPVILAGQTMSALGDAAAKNLPPKDFGGDLKACDSNPACRRAFARYLVNYQGRTPSGGWTVPDAVVDEQTKGEPLMDLILRAQHHADASKRECLNSLGRVRQKILREGGEWTDGDDLKVYDTLGANEPHCLSLLQLEPPSLKLEPRRNNTEKESSAPPKKTREDTKKDKLNFLQRYNIGRQCFGEQHKKQFCESIVSGVVSLFVPVPGASLVSKAVKTGHVLNAENVALKGASAEEHIAASASSTATSAVIPSVAAARQSLIQNYGTRVFSNEVENRAFIKAFENPPKGTEFLVVDNSALKTLNTKTGDKNIGTAVTNLHKDLFLKNLEGLKAKYPSLQVDVTTVTYNDYKSVKIAISGLDGMPSATKAQLEKDLDELLLQTNKDFAVRIKDLALENAGNGDPEKWFRGARGNDGEITEAAVRHGRDVEGHGGFIDANAPGTQAELTQKLVEAEAARVDIANSPQFKTLMDTSEGVAIPNSDVFTMMRKSETPEQLREALRTQYQSLDLTTADAQKLMDYSNKVNGFTPTLLIPKRENLDLSAASSGGLTADFIGLGAANLQATARGIAGRTELKSALTGARQGERQVTAQFQEKMEKFKSIVGKDALCTGDDCAKIASAVMTDREKARIMNSLADNSQTRHLRVSFFGEGVPENIRMQVASQGELIEKSLRKELARKIDPNKLDRMTFGLDMKTSRAESGMVNLMIGRQSGIALSKSERETIEAAFTRALESYNKNVRSFRAGNVVTMERRIFLIPNGATLVDSDDSK